MLGDDIDRSLADLVAQWNIAEQRIKRAEQVRGNEVVAAAIFELRYAGRKIVDTIDLVLRHDIEKDAAAKEKVHRYIADAIEDCIKAKHDAIDAMLNFVTTWFDEAEKKIGLSKVKEFFPNYLEVTSKISVIQAQIADSRGDRDKLIDGIYNGIDENDYNQILDLYQTMKNSRERVTSVARSEKSKSRILIGLTILSLLFGLSGWYNYIFPRTPPKQEQPKAGAATLPTPPSRPSNITRP